MKPNEFSTLQIYNMSRATLENKLIVALDQIKWMEQKNSSTYQMYTEASERMKRLENEREATNQYIELLEKTVETLRGKYDQ